MLRADQKRRAYKRRSGMNIDERDPMELEFKESVIGRLKKMQNVLNSGHLINSNKLQDKMMGGETLALSK